MRKETVLLIDDLDDSEADVGTVAFSYRGADYEIDLSAANAERFDKAMTEFIDASRPVKTTRTRRVRSGGKPSGSAQPSSTASSGASKGNTVEASAPTIRAWARANDIPVPTKGRIPFDVREKFAAAN